MTSNLNEQNTSLFPGKNWEKRAKILTQALLVSVALNLGLLATFFYTVLEKKEQEVVFEMPPPSERNHTVLLPSLSNGELLACYTALSFQELLALLDNEELVEEGYRKRDLALGSLVAFHFFNLEKALGAPPVQKRTVSFIHKDQEKVDVTIFPGFSTEQYEAVKRYAKTEKWPFTAEGLFYELKHAPTPQAIVLSSEASPGIWFRRAMSITAFIMAAGPQV